MNGGRKLKILVANGHLHTIGGTETFTYTLISALKHLGHEVEYFTFSKGITSGHIEKDLKVKFMCSDSYDLVLANHKICVKELVGKGLIIQTCHSIFLTEEQPSMYAHAFVAISQEVQNHLCNQGFNSKIILNSIDTKRFVPQKPIGLSLNSVMSLCQSDLANEKVQKACDILGVKFEAYNKYKNADWAIEDKINNADLVVGIGRSAYDAMACGRAVIIFDSRNDYMPSAADGYLNQNLVYSIKKNCSGRYFNYQFTPESLVWEMQKYNPADGLFLREFAEKELCSVKNAQAYIRYFESIGQNQGIRNRFFYLKALIGSPVSGMLNKLLKSVRR